MALRTLVAIALHLLSAPVIERLNIAPSQAYAHFDAFPRRASSAHRHDVYQIPINDCHNENHVLSNPRPRGSFLLVSSTFSPTLTVITDSSMGYAPISMLTERRPVALRRAHWLRLPPVISYLKQPRFSSLTKARELCNISKMPLRCQCSPRRVKD